MRRLNCNYRDGTLCKNRLLLNNFSIRTDIHMDCITIINSKIIKLCKVNKLCPLYTKLQIICKITNSSAGEYY